MQFQFSFDTKTSDIHPDANEDAAAYDDNGLWAIVCDGVGGSSAAASASRLVRDTISKLLVTNSANSNQTNEHFLKEALQKTNTLLIDEHIDGQTTATALQIISDSDECRALVGHVGDSRLYLFRNDNLTQITKDDSVIPHKISQVIENNPKESEYSEREKKAFQVRNILTQAMGNEEALDIHTYSVVIKSGDILLLTSDGIHDNLLRPEIEEIVKQKDNIATNLISHAYKRSKESLLRSKPDDMTAIAIVAI